MEQYETGRPGVSASLQHSLFRKCKLRTNRQAVRNSKASLSPAKSSHLAAAVGGDDTSAVPSCHKRRLQPASGLNSVRAELGVGSSDPQRLQLLKRATLLVKGAWLLVVLEGTSMMLCGIPPLRLLVRLASITLWKTGLNKKEHEVSSYASPIIFIEAMPNAIHRLCICPIFISMCLKLQ